MVAPHVSRTEEVWVQKKGRNAVGQTCQTLTTGILEKTSTPKLANNAKTVYNVIYHSMHLDIAVYFYKIALLLFLEPVQARRDPW